MLSFGGSLSLDYIRIPGSVKRLANTTGYWEMFYWTEVTLLELCEGVTALGAEVFHSAEIGTMILPSSLEEVEENAFLYASVDRIFFHGTQAQCPQALQDQAAGIGAPIYFYSETQPAASGNYWHYADGEPVVW